MKNSTQKTAVTKPDGVTVVLKHCLELDIEARERYLEELRDRNLETYEEVQTLLSTGESALVDNDLFLSGLLQLAATEKVVIHGEKEVSEFHPVEIGKYVMLQELGRGGMAEIFRGKTRGVLGFERPVAIKKILTEHTKDPSFREMFEFEAHLSALLHHPNIVQVFDFFYHKKSFFLVMEYVHGKNLLEILLKLNSQKLLLPLDCALLVMLEILKGLEYAHTKVDENTGEKLNVVHRDICPRNIMVSYTGSVKIVDFGIAKAINRTDVTDTGAFRGTVSYMAPELLDGMEPDRRSDVFAAGLVFYELLTGKTLFKAGTVVSTLEMIRKCDVARHTKSIKTDEKLLNILKRALAKDRSARYQSAEDFRVDLQHFLYEQFPKATDKKFGYILKSLFSEEIESELRTIKEAEEHIELSRTKPKGENVKNKALEWGLVASLIFLLVGGSIWYLRPKPPNPPLPVEVTKKVEPPKPVATAPVVSVAPVPVVKKREVTALGNCQTLIRTKPAKAQVSVNGETMGTTPMVIGLVCDTPVKVKLELEGYRQLEHEIKVKKSGSGLSFNLEPK